MASNDDFYTLDPEAEPESIANYCGEYVKQMAVKQGIINGQTYAVVVINGVIASVFERMS